MAMRYPRANLDATGRFRCADTARNALPRAATGAAAAVNVSSPIRTLTVGPGISPGQSMGDIATSARAAMESRAVAAGGEFHPAPRTSHPYL